MAKDEVEVINGVEVEGKPGAHDHRRRGHLAEVAVIGADAVAELDAAVSSEN